MNLWDETIETLERSGHTWGDVVAVCGNAFCISKEQFEGLAKKADYYNGYGSAEIATDLKIIGDNWWLSRDEYDGSEWWRYNIFPEVSNLPTVEITRLCARDDNMGSYWKYVHRSLREMNEGEV